MISEAELNRLLLRAMNDSREQWTFMRALLDATVYAHVPVSDDSGRYRFVMFSRPDNGEMALPFFIDEAEAYATVGPDRRVVALNGRLFLEATLGAPLLLEPNRAQCPLYPEAIRALLSETADTKFSTSVIPANQDILIGRGPEEVERVLAQALTTLPRVKKAFLAVMAKPETPNEYSLVVVLCIPSSATKEATIALSQVVATGSSLKTSLMTYEPHEEPPEFLLEAGVEPFYTR